MCVPWKARSVTASAAPVITGQIHFLRGFEFTREVRTYLNLTVSFGKHHAAKQRPTGAALKHRSRLHLLQRSISTLPVKWAKSIKRSSSRGDFFLSLSLSLCSAFFKTFLTPLEISRTSAVGTLLFWFFFLVYHLCVLSWCFHLVKVTLNTDETNWK